MKKRKMKFLVGGKKRKMLRGLVTILTQNIRASNSVSPLIITAVYIIVVCPAQHLSDVTDSFAPESKIGPDSPHGSCLSNFYFFYDTSS